jgi:hypothetical protein
MIRETPRPRVALPPIRILCSLASPAAATAFGGVAVESRLLMDAPAHARWVDACGKLGGRRSDALSRRALHLGLPAFCNVHNGMAFPPGSRTTRDKWPKAAISRRPSRRRPPISSRGAMKKAGRALRVEAPDDGRVIAVEEAFDELGPRDPCRRTGRCNDP